MSDVTIQIVRAVRTERACYAAAVGPTATDVIEREALLTAQHSARDAWRHLAGRCSEDTEENIALRSWLLLASLAGAH